MNAIVTGASKGIGKAIAEKLVKEGMDVAICARNEADLLATVAELKSYNSSVTILYEVRDLSKKEEAIAFGKSVLNQFKKIDLVVNNAGTFIPGDLSTEEDGLLETLIETNLYSAYHVTRAVLPLLQEQKSGHIFNICSVAGLKPYKQGGSYSISKFALVGFSQNLREELKPYHIKVTTVNPGATMSDSWKGSLIDENRILKASDIADAIWSVYNLSPQAVVEEITLRPLLGDL